MLAQRIAALAINPYARTLRSISTSFVDRVTAQLRALAPQRRFQVLGAIAAGTLAGFLVAAVVRRARLGCAVARSRGGAAGAREREPDVGPTPVEARPTPQGEAAAAPVAEAASEAGAAEAAEAAVLPAAGPPEEPAYAFEPEAMVDLPDGLRPPVTPRIVPASATGDLGEPELATVR